MESLPDEAKIESAARTLDAIEPGGNSRLMKRRSLISFAIVFAVGAALGLLLPRFSAK